VSKFVVHVLVEADTWQEAYAKLEKELDLRNYRDDLHLSGGVHIPEQCYLCHGSGCVEVPDWDDKKDCSCCAGPGSSPEYNGMHEYHCGLMPCPAGCPVTPRSS
jgi:hypothetical protein